MKPSNPSRTPGKKRRILLFAAGIVLLLFLLTAGIALVLCARLFSVENVTRPAVAPEDMAISRAAQFKILSAAASVRNSAPGAQPAGLVLSAKEFNLVSDLLCGLPANVFPGTPALRDSALRIGRDAFLFEHSRDTGVKTPFGSRVRLCAEIELRIENGDSFFAVRSGKVGSMALPVRAKRGILAKWERFKKTEGHARLLSAVESLRIENGELRVKYRPYEMKNLIPGDFSGKIGQTFGADRGLLPK